MDAVSLAQDKRLPRLAIEFQLDDEGEHVPGHWALSPGLGSAIENYVSALREMEKIRFEHSSIDGLTCELQKAFEAVVAAANTLAKLGWPVNWEQNVQVILSLTEYGIRDGKLIDRFLMLPKVMTLGDELLLLGTVTFYHQTRSADGVVSFFRSKTIVAANEFRFKDIPLRLRDEEDEVPARFRYFSDWMPHKSGASCRIAI
jgi:hypothetical protein